MSLPSIYFFNTKLTCSPITGPMSAVQSPISAPHFIPRFSNTTKPHIMPPLTRPRIKNPNFCWYPTWFRPIYPIRVTEHSSALVGDGLNNEESEDYMSVDQIKEEIYKIVKDINRGIFGVASEKKSHIENLVKLLESQNPTLNLDKVGGRWKLIYSTVTILGSKRTKLGLRDFISLGDIFQTIDVAKGKAVNMIEFDVKGLNLLNGKLSIEASFKIVSKSRVDISYENSSIIPDQLMNVFRKNYDLLLGIFNPEGWLEITYIDDTTRIGRDDKGNLFILEKSEENS